MLLKIENGKIVSPKIVDNVFQGQGRVIFNPKKDDLIALGYKEYEAEQPEQSPKQGHYWAYEWAIKDGEIVALWSEKELADESI